MNLLLARHASSTPPSRTSRFIGARDLELTEEGRAQTQALAEYLRNKAITRCVSSPQKRARQTAEPVAAALGLRVEVDADLREIDFGRWEGLTFAEISAADPAAVQRWADFAPDFTFPGGEALADFLARIQRAGARLRTAPHQTVLAVTHGGVIRAMLCHLLGLPARKYVLFEIRPASVATVKVFDGLGVLSGLCRTGFQPVSARGEDCL